MNDARRRARGAAALALLVAAVWLTSPSPLLADDKPPPLDLRAGNLLVNPGFEGPFDEHGAPELTVGAGWTPWFDEGEVRPEFKDELYQRARPDGSIQSYSLRVHHGEAVQKFFSSSSTHDAGFYQQVQVAPGSRLRFSVWAHTWSSDCDDPCVSPLAPCRPGSQNSHGTYIVQAGIDPTGGLPDRLGAAAPASVQWAEPIVFEAYEGWHRLVVEVEAAGDTVTVYTRGRPEWPVKHNDSYWDDARLEMLESGTPTPIPTDQPTEPTPPTATPSPVLGEAIYLPRAVRRGGAAAPPTTPAATEPPTRAPTLPPPSPVPTDTATATAAPTATVAPSPTPVEPCWDLVRNGGFETGTTDGWLTGPDGPARPAVVAEPGPGGGDYSLRVGVASPQADQGASWAWAAQTVVVPGEAISATVAFDVRSVSSGAADGDWQMVALRDGEGLPVQLLAWRPGGEIVEWSTVSVPLNDLAAIGRTLRITAEVFNDGDGAPTALFVDNVRLVACREAKGARTLAPVPPFADVRIEYPIRTHPGQENFNLPPTCEERDFESLIVRNRGQVRVEMGGWTLTSRAGDTYTFPPIRLDDDEYVRVWTRRGEDVTDGHFSDVYWNRDEPVWDDVSDEAVIVDNDGTEVARRGYP